MEQQTTKKYQEIILKERFYSDKAGYFVLLVAFSVITIVFLIFILSYIIITEPQSKYFRSSANGQIFYSQPLEKPIYSNAQIADWTAQAVIRAFDFNFINYRHQIFSSKVFFTNSGHNIFIKQVQNLFLKDLASGKYSAKLSLCDIATIDKDNSKVITVDGTKRYAWLVFLPVYLQLQNSKDSNAVVAQILVKVQRMSDLDYLGGLAIDDIRIIRPTPLDYTGRTVLPACSNG